MDKLHEESRKQFEHEIKLRGMSAMKRDGRYVESATRFAFDFWQASRESIVVELTNELRVETIVDKRVQQAFVNGHLLGRKECSDALRSIGLSIKGEVA